MSVYLDVMVVVMITFSEFIIMHMGLVIVYPAPVRIRAVRKVNMMMMDCTGGMTVISLYHPWPKNPCSCQKMERNLTIPKNMSGSMK